MKLSFISERFSKYLFYHKRRVPRLTYGSGVGECAQKEKQMRDCENRKNRSLSLLCKLPHRGLSHVQLLMLYPFFWSFIYDFTASAVRSLTVPMKYDRLQKYGFQ